MNMPATRERGNLAIEIIIVVAIIGLLSGAITTFQRDVFVKNFILQENLNAEHELRSSLRKMITEIRPATSSDLGAYPIFLAEDNEFGFFSDSNSDGSVERIRYFLDGTILKRGSITPSGSPLSYNPSNEQVSTLATNVIIGGDDIFLYYDGNFTGTGNPLVQPIDILSIRLIAITLTVDANPVRLPSPITSSTQVTIRSLKGAQ